MTGTIFDHPTIDCVIAVCNALIDQAGGSEEGRSERYLHRGSMYRRPANTNGR